MKNSRGIKYYVRFYFIVLLGYSVIALVDTYNNDWTPNRTLLISLSYFPLLFVMFVYIFDTILEKVFPKLRRDKKVENKEYSDFLTKCTRRINDELKFDLEDFRQLRENDRFQRAIQQAYSISVNGETKEMNFEYLSKKFKQNTNEYRAFKIVLDEVQKMI